jgi:integrase
MADFRHSFITLRLLQWHKQGVDLSLKAQFLQAFVGHNRLEDTLYYFRLVPEVLSVYGEVGHEQ